jgi:hypothetical protein
MSFAFGSSAQRQLILDRVRKQLLIDADQLLFESVNFSDWNDAFDQLNVTYWNGTLSKIPVNTVHTKKKWYGLYTHGSKIDLNMRYGLSTTENLGVLLHEMCHHYVEETYQHGYSAANGGRVIGHGKEWKREMRRVGYTGKISRFSGYERFV